MLTATADHKILVHTSWGLIAKPPFWLEKP